MPYFLFRYAQELEQETVPEEKKREIFDDFKRLGEWLLQLQNEGRIDPRIRHLLVSMTGRVAESLAGKHSDIRKEGKAMLSGTVLEYEAKTIYNEGEAKGRAEERRISEKKQRTARVDGMIEMLLRLGQTDAEAASNLQKALECSEEEAVSRVQKYHAEHDIGSSK